MRLITYKSLKKYQYIQGEKFIREVLRKTEQEGACIYRSLKRKLKLIQKNLDLNKKRLDKMSGIG